MPGSAYMYAASEASSCPRTPGLGELPPPPFLPKFYQDPAEVTGGGKCTLFGGGFRPNKKKHTTSVAELSLSQSKPLKPRIGSHRSSSEGRLSTAASRLSSVAASEDDGMDIWDMMAPISLRDHVAQIMTQPLPTKGETESLKVPDSEPRHHRMIPSSVQGTYIYDSDFKRGCRAQKASEQWRGFPKHNYSVYNEQCVVQKSLMRK
eukprot:TRINITY_DN80218_c0_g1_i1.p1 TRINITY_DN80218_c0_g1~~TRINITY_DN80218_c0_g1_i1.p1  ORF type:complete len:206 (-),score=26.18 TRINITY_DN80218_c0_g1_i1:153-770(-)